MKKIAISLLVLALVAAFSATGVVSAATCAATTTTCATTTSAQCTSTATAACCCCPCPVVCCCPVVTCCVVTKCCEVKVVKAASAVAVAKAPAGAAAAASAAGRDNVAAQSSAQNAKITQIQTTGAISGSNNTVSITFGDATIEQFSGQTNLQLKNVEINPAITFGANNTGTQIAPVLSPGGPALMTDGAPS
jgi:hypothetical protein